MGVASSFTQKLTELNFSGAKGAGKVLIIIIIYYLIVIIIFRGIKVHFYFVLNLQVQNIAFLSHIFICHTGPLHALLPHRSIVIYSKKTRSKYCMPHCHMGLFSHMKMQKWNYNSTELHQQQKVRIILSTTETTTIYEQNKAKPR